MLPGPFENVNTPLNHPELTRTLDLRFVSFCFWKPLHHVISIPNIEQQPDVARSVCFSIEAWIGEGHFGRYDGQGKIMILVCLTSRCWMSMESTLWSGQISPRRGFFRARSSVWHVMDLVSGRSCRVGSLGRLRLDIHSLLLDCEKSQITKRAKSVTD